MNRYLVAAAALTLSGAACALPFARPALLAAVDLWPTYRGEATYLAVEFTNDVSDEIFAAFGAQAQDMEAFLSGRSDREAFVQTWWYQDYD